MTQRKKVGLGIIISGAVGIVVGVVVMATTTTPLIIPLIVDFVIMVGGSLFSLAIVKPDIPA